MTYKRGDVVLIRFPNADLKTYKKRPALIVQGDELQTGLQQKIVALITSNLNRTGSTGLLVKQSDTAGKIYGSAYRFGSCDR